MPHKMKHNPMNQKIQQPLHLKEALKCGAKTRKGNPCQCPAVKHKKRCRLHGGAEGSGAPEGKRNGNYKHGLFTKEQKAIRQELRDWAKMTKQFMGRL